jgi:hypothetical protein
MSHASWVTRLQGVDYCCWTESKFQQLCYPSCTTLWHSVSWAKHFSDFLSVCSSLAPMSFNFSSVSILHLRFCLLSIKSHADLSLFMKLSIVCLLGTLSSRNLRQNFQWHVLADHISHRSHTEIHTALKYTAPWQNTLLANCNQAQLASGADNCCLLLIYNKQIPTHELHCMPWNIMLSSGPQS